MNAGREEGHALWQLERLIRNGAMSNRREVADVLQRPLNG